MIRQTILIVLGIACAGVARAEMPQELVEMLARAEVPPNARAEVEAGGAPVWIFERDTGSQQITVAGFVKLSSAPQQIADDFFRRDSLLETDILKASGAFSEPAVLGDVANYRVPESDLEVLADCEIHACKFKLGRRGAPPSAAISTSPTAGRFREATGMLLEAEGKAPVGDRPHTPRRLPQESGPWGARSPALERS